MGSNELEWVSEERRKKAFNKQLCALMYKLQTFSQGNRAVLVLSKSHVLVSPGVGPVDISDEIQP